MRFNLALYVSRCRRLLCEIAIDFLAVLQVVRNHRIDFGQRERIEAVGDLFWRVPLQEGRHHRLEPDARLPDQNRSVRGDVSRCFLR